MITQQQQYHRPQFAPDWAKTPSPPSTMISSLENGELVINSIDLAPGLGVQHRALIATIRTHQASIERFGRVLFQKAPFDTKGGSQEVTFVKLNENQALLVGSFSKNTVQVVAFKVTLVEEFDKARKAVATLFKKPESLQAEQIAGLVALCNDLQAKLIETNRKADAIIKYREKVYQAKVVEKQKEQQVVDREKYEAERNEWRKGWFAMFERYIQTDRYADPKNIMRDVFIRLKEMYGLDIKSQVRYVGEHELDVCYRVGWKQQIKEVIAHQMPNSPMYR